MKGPKEDNSARQLYKQNKTIFLEGILQGMI